MNDHPPLETERLILAPLAEAHAPALFDVYRDAETVRFWADPPHRTADVTSAMIRRFLAGTETAWALIPRGTDEAIGVVYYLGNPGPPGMGYILRRDQWRKGFTSEAVAGALKHGFGPMGLERVELWIDRENIASQGVAAHNRFSQRGSFWQQFPHRAARHQSYVFGLTIEEWRGAPAQIPPIESVEPILPVPNVQKAANYYRDTLGFRIGFLYGTPVTHAGVILSEWSNSGPRVQLTQADAAAAGMSLYFNVGPDMEKLYADMQARGAEIARPLAKMPWGGREFAVRDLNGYLLRFG